MVDVWLMKERVWGEFFVICFIILCWVRWNRGVGIDMVVCMVVLCWWCLWLFVVWVMDWGGCELVVFMVIVLCSVYVWMVVCVVVLLLFVWWGWGLCFGEVRGLVFYMRDKGIVFLNYFVGEIKVSVWCNCDDGSRYVCVEVIEFGRVIYGRMGVEVSILFVN